ncbi:MAG: amidohydrolase [Deltaproteobacteria bacterium]|nr:amidohydrolase [Deltaproteobacteria bacterium]
MASAHVLHDGVVHTMVAGAPPAEALAWADGRIVAVGTKSQVVAEVGSDATAMDLAGRCLLPGFIDAHHHFSGAVIDGLAVDCSPAQAPSIDAIVERLTQAAGGAASDQWLVGVGYDELALVEGRHPTRADLDRIETNRPVLLHHYSCHEGVVSSTALAKAGIDRHSPDPPAGVIEHDRQGDPSGRIVETAFSTVAKLAEDSLLNTREDEYLAGLTTYQSRLFQVGITRVCDPLVPAEIEELYRRAVAEGHLQIPVVMLPGSSKGHLAPPWDRLHGTTTGHGPEHLRIGHLKVFLDGATRCALALTLKQAGQTILDGLAQAWRARSLSVVHEAGDMSFHLDPDLRLRSGVRYLSRSESRALTAEACDRGFSVAFHAIGNDAVRQAIDAFAHVGSRHPRTPPPRIEHATILEPALARQAAELGICLVSQPHFLELPAFQAIPIPPGLALLAHRTMLDAGLHVAGSSDAPVTGFDPLAALRCAVTRRCSTGARLQPKEAVTPAEVLAMYTREAAYATGSLAECGTLEPGKRADLVVLNGDPTAAGPGSSLDDLVVERTILGGETVYEIESG